MYPEKSTYNLDEAQQQLAVSRRTLQRLITRGQLAVVKKPNGIRVVRTEAWDDELIRPSQAARRLGVSKATVYRWLDEGRLQGVRLSPGTVRIYRQSVDQALARGAVGEELCAD